MQMSSDKQYLEAAPQVGHHSLLRRLLVAMDIGYIYRKQGISFPAAKYYLQRRLITYVGKHLTIM